MTKQELSNSDTLASKEQESLATAQVTAFTELRKEALLSQGTQAKTMATAPAPKKANGERKRLQKKAKFVGSNNEVEHAGEDSLNKFLSDASRYGFTHKLGQNSKKPGQAQESQPSGESGIQSKVITDNRLNQTKLEQVTGTWIYDLAHGGFAIDSTMAAILGINKFNGYLEQDFIFQHFDEVKRGHIQHYMDAPLLGDLVFRNVTLIKGPHAGKRFTFQGQILRRNSLGQTVKAMGSFAYENSPYAEFLTREIANDGLFIWDRKRQRVMSNTAYHQQLDYTEDEFPNTLPDLMGLLHPDDNDILSLQGHILSNPQYGDSYECCTRLRKSDKNYIWTTVRTLVTERNAEGEATKMIGAVTNIDMLQENFDNLKMLMFTDPLTGLHNRTYFHQNQLRYEDPKLFPVSVIFLDVSALKLTNDILGHNYGDFLLLKASQLLQNALQVTLSELKADDELVQSFIDERTALSKQTSQLGAVFRQDDIVPEEGEQKSQDLGKVQPKSTLNLDSERGVSLNANEIFELEVTGENEVSFGYTVPNKDSAKASTKSLQATDHIALDCLDNPEGCLIKESDLNAKDRAILALPDDFFDDLESKGVSPVSLSSGHKYPQDVESLGDSAQADVNNDSGEQEHHSVNEDAGILNLVSQVTGEKAHEQERLSAQEAHDQTMLLQSGEGLGFLDDEPEKRPSRIKPTIDDLKGELNAEIKHKNEIKYPPEILRMGGDEFIVLCPNCTEREIRKLYENIFKIRDSLLANQIACPIEQRSVPLCFGIGYATVGEDGEHNDDFFQALQRADYRMQANKEKYHDKHYELLQAYFEEKLNRRVSMRDDRRVNILSQKERNKLRQHLQD